MTILTTSTKNLMYNKLLCLLIKTAIFFTVLLGAAHPVIAATQTFTIADHNGDLVTLPKEAERIVTLWPALVAVIVALDQGAERLTAMPPTIKRSFGRGIMFEIFPELQNVAAEGVIDNKRQPSIEALLQLEPDLVLQDANNMKSIEALRASGLTVFGVAKKRVGLEKFLLTELGAVLNRQERADQILAWLDESYQTTKTKTDKIAINERPIAVYLWHNNKLVGPRHHAHHLLQTAGARNGVVKNKAFLGYDPEKLLKINPDFIFLHHIGTKCIKEDFYNNPVYAGLKAVKNRTIYKVPMGGGANWDSPSPERGFSFAWFARIINGYDFLVGSIRNSVKKGFPLLYGTTINDQQITRMLSTSANRYSAHYNEIIK